MAIDGDLGDQGDSLEKVLAGASMGNHSAPTSPKFGATCTMEDDAPSSLTM